MGDMYEPTKTQCEGIDTYKWEINAAVLKKFGALLSTENNEDQNVPIMPKLQHGVISVSVSAEKSKSVVATENVYPYNF